MKHHHIQNVGFTDDTMHLAVDNKEYSFDLKSISKPLFQASAEKRIAFEYDSFGYGIHWPELDEDLSIDGLLGSLRKIDNTKEFISV